MQRRDINTLEDNTLNYSTTFTNQIMLQLLFMCQVTLTVLVRMECMPAPSQGSVTHTTPVSMARAAPPSVPLVSITPMISAPVSGLANLDATIAMLLLLPHRGRLPDPTATLE